MRHSEKFLLEQLEIMSHARKNGKEIVLTKHRRTGTNFINQTYGKFGNMVDAYEAYLMEKKREDRNNIINDLLDEE